LTGDPVKFLDEASLMLTLRRAPLHHGRSSGQAFVRTCESARQPLRLPADSTGLSGRVSGCAPVHRNANRAACAAVRHRAVDPARPARSTRALQRTA
jgi:hypothetical protein